MAGLDLDPRLDDLHQGPDRGLQGPGRIIRPHPGPPRGSGRPRHAAPGTLETTGAKKPVTTNPILDATGVAKNYGAVAALKNASLSVLPGEVHALMGANGAGKSTLVKILTGAVPPSGGRILDPRRDARFSLPGAARRAGLVPVYQEPSLIPDLDIASNLRLTRTPVEPFAEWVRELGVPDLDLARHGARRAARHPARARPRPRAWPRSRTCCCSTK